jgi:transcriptional regulator with XRE-family HTH domain
LPIYGQAANLRSTPMADDAAAERLGKNLRKLRETRGLSQQQIAKLAGVPRATWANMESGSANPTLTVLNRAATALQVSIEELIARPRDAANLYRRDALQERRQGSVRVRKLLPDPIPGMVIERLELPPRSRLVGVPHTPGTREYLTCESGPLVLTASGESWQLDSGDVAAFRGDQRHSYFNPGPQIAVGYSVVVLARFA